MRNVLHKLGRIWTLAVHFFTGCVVVIIDDDDDDDNRFLASL
jgi:hypothetical protein